MPHARQTFTVVISSHEDTSPSCEEWRRSKTRKNTIIMIFESILAAMVHDEEMIYFQNNVSILATVTHFFLPYLR